MKLFPLILTAALALVLLPSCGSGPGRIDARNPTIAQMDDLDVQWGLQRRVSRGTPKRLYPNLPGDTAPAGEAATPASSGPAPAQPAAAPAPAPAAQPQAPVTVDPSVINKLR